MAAEQMVAKWTIRSLHEVSVDVVRYRLNPVIICDPLGLRTVFDDSSITHLDVVEARVSEVGH
jgi:hypothetical protein